MARMLDQHSAAATGNTSSRTWRREEGGMMATDETGVKGQDGWSRMVAAGGCMHGHA